MSTFDHKLDESDYALAFALKTKGNVAFKAKDYQNALKYYSQILLHLGMNRAISLHQLTSDNLIRNVEIPHDPSIRSAIQLKIDELRLVAFNNMAATYLKLDKYEQVIDYASRVIKENPLNRKALFRRGMAFRMIGKFNDALSDMTNAAKTKTITDIDPAIQRELYLLRKCQYLKHFDALLSQNEISVMDQTSFNDTLYTKMKVAWEASNGVDTFHLKIETIYKIKKNYTQNMKIYDALLSAKRFKMNQKEGMLFHGTSLENIKKIINTGFNRDYNIKSVYGKGTYFSNKAVIAARYCTKIDSFNVFAMLACKTYIGDSTEGRCGMMKNEFYKQDKITQYDSLVNDLENPSIFVINRDYHSVPCFVIVFTFRRN